MSMKYRPSNGSEGTDFTEYFCNNCKRDINEDCQISAHAFAFDVNDPEYPPELVYDSSGNPTCTAFIDIESDEEIPEPRPELTIEDFM